MRGKVRAHDPFELIRWLALSQPDPRKALAELVQNSLDAVARHVRVTRVRERGAACLRILDDGDGVIPELDRPAALRYIATHIGHSRKRDLSPQQRLELMTQGQYGIGLLGFWSLGQQLEMRTAIPGQRPHRLILHRDDPDFLIEPIRGRLGLDERWTEVVVIGLHREAQAALLGRRAADFLGAELRGQLLDRDVALVVEDRMARGLARKLIPVKPPRYLGERVEGIGPLEIPGHPPIRFEVYVTGDEPAAGSHTGLAVYAAGTLVTEGFADLGALDLDHAPWTDPRLGGFVDFPGLRVAPGSRRGVVVDAAAGAFAGALRTVEPILVGILEARERRRAEELDRSMIRDLQHAFRDLQRHRPRYAMLPVAKPEGATGGGPGSRLGEGETGAIPSGEEAAREDAVAERAPKVGRTDLLPPGPLAGVRIVPAAIRIEVLGSRRVRALGVDAVGRSVEEPARFSWKVLGAVGDIETSSEDGSEAVLRAPADPAHGSLEVLASADVREARGEASVEVLADLHGSRADEGIPEPELVDLPGVTWRSRFQEGSWQVNSGHRDFRAVADKPALKLRYLALLFAKEIVLRSSQDPRLDPSLEQLVEVAAFADRNIARQRRGRLRHDPS